MRLKKYSNFNESSKVDIPMDKFNAWIKDQDTKKFIESLSLNKEEVVDYLLTLDDESDITYDIGIFKNVNSEFILNIGLRVRFLDTTPQVDRIGCTIENHIKTHKMVGKTLSDILNVCKRIQSGLDMKITDYLPVMYKTDNILQYVYGFNFTKIDDSYVDALRENYIDWYRSIKTKKPDWKIDEFIDAIRRELIYTMEDSGILGPEEYIIIEPHTFTVNGEESYNEYSITVFDTDVTTDVISDVMDLSQNPSDLIDWDSLQRAIEGIQSYQD